MNFKLASLLILMTLGQALAGAPELINGKPVGKLFGGVGTFNFSCTITKVGPRQFLTAAHCVGNSLRTLDLSFPGFAGRVNVKSMHVHPSWLKDCAGYHCTGTEVGGPRMTPGRSDVVLLNVKEETPKIVVINVGYKALPVGTEVALVGAGCTRGVEPGGRSVMRYALTKLQPFSKLIHPHSLYKDIAEITAQADWITDGYAANKQEASLCPGDSGGPMLAKNEAGEWEIVGIAADYTFDHAYHDGDESITNLHTRLDDESYNRVGFWIRQVWEN